ncbi:DUF2249 domain-containing protein [Haloarculaceae archaeon H-GB2-1]|nr:DUF2249 domain-containing protein [Haloarculaceae archaeon H-GB1-1]MEA5386435.1 DUF2249 domain-containing protein [Haloarculaceae archaeon H-GB11]MEA5407948.1 DUF2249 domain-containing protein [Haloarculaceae archaeon H-GB2-1]
MATDESAAGNVLDVREVDGEPFEAIMTALDDVDDESLTLVNGFEPTPLFGVLEREGFEYAASQRDDGSWSVEIWRD